MKRKGKTQIAHGREYLYRFPARRSFADRFRIARIAAGLTQAQIAKTLRCQASAISYWNKEHRGPSLRLLRKLPALLDVSIDWLLGVTDNPERSK